MASSQTYIFVVMITLSLVGGASLASINWMTDWKVEFGKANNCTILDIALNAITSQLASVLKLPTFPPSLNVTANLKLITQLQSTTVAITAVKTTSCLITTTTTTTEPTTTEPTTTEPTTTESTTTLPSNECNDTE